jgi:hypothetical protein
MVMWQRLWACALMALPDRAVICIGSASRPPGMPGCCRGRLLHGWVSSLYWCAAERQLPGAVLAAPALVPLWRAVSRRGCDELRACRTRRPCWRRCGRRAWRAGRQARRQRTPRRRHLQQPRRCPAAGGGARAGAWSSPRGCWPRPSSRQPTCCSRSARSSASACCTRRRSASACWRPAASRAWPARTCRACCCSGRPPGPARPTLLMCVRILCALGKRPLFHVTALAKQNMLTLVGCSATSC